MSTFLNNVKPRVKYAIICVETNELLTFKYKDEMCFDSKKLAQGLWSVAYQAICHSFDKKEYMSVALYDTAEKAEEGFKDALSLMKEQGINLPGETFTVIEICVDVQAEPIYKIKM